MWPCPWLRWLFGVIGRPLRKDDIDVEVMWVDGRGVDGGASVLKVCGKLDLSTALGSRFAPRCDAIMHASLNGGPRCARRDVYPGLWDRVNLDTDPEWGTASQRQPLRS